MNAEIKKTINFGNPKINATDIEIPRSSGLVTKTQFDSDKQSLEKKISDVNQKIPNTRGLVKKTDSNKKCKETSNEISNITGLVTTIVPNAKGLEI